MLLAILAVVAAGACWGLSAVIAKVAFDRGVPPVRMAEARVVVALVVLLAVLLVAGRRELLVPPRPARAPLVLFGLCVAGVNAAYYVAIDRLTVGTAIGIQYVGPVLLLALAAVTSRRSPGAVAWVAGGLSLVGAILVSGAFRGSGDVDTLGLVAAASSAFLFAGYLLTAELSGRRGTEPATVLLWGFVVAIAFWTLVAPWWSWPWAKLGEPQVLLSVLGVGLVGTLIPFFLAVGAVRVLSPATAGIAATSEPPFAAAFAWVFLGQALTGAQLVGMAMVVVAVILAQRASAEREATVLEFSA